MYPIWFTPDFPLSEINSSDRVDRTGREDWRHALAEDIRKRGLANPLIVLNHRDPAGYQPNWLMTGTNRLWALSYLEWTHAPAIVTGECTVPGAIRIAPEEVQLYFSDGEVYFGNHGPRLRNVCKPERYEYPTSCKAGFHNGTVSGLLAEAEA